MTAALFRVQDLGAVMGGWPFMRSSDGSSTTQLISGVVDSKARIVGTVQEPSAGFAGLDTLSFQLYVDSDPNSPFTVTFSDPGASGLTCDQVVSQINGTTTPGPLPGTVAYNENNFVVLKSVTEGEGGYLKLASVAGSEAVAGILGLFSETEAFGGQLAQAPHIDPDRQVAMPGQGSMIWGENFSANAFNRLAMQMAVHADRSIGVLERKRLAVFKRKARAVADIQTSGSDKYFRLITTPGPTDEEWIYMGPYASGHAEFDPELALAIVDADGNEITVEDETIVDETSVPSEMSFSYETDSEFQLITNSSVPAIFAGVNETGDYYVRVTGLTGSASSLNGRLLKITLKISSSEVVVQALSSSGVRVPITDANKTGTMTMEAVQLVTKKVKAEGFYKESALTTRLEQVQETKVASVGITGLQLNNRVVVSGETFLSTVVAGDIATISGHTNTVPHSNNGAYRVSKVVDNETLELVGEDWGPVYLNTQTAVSLGDLTITSDGDFFDNPYIKFDDPDVVPPGDFYVLYQAMRTFKDAVEEDPGVFAAPTKYLQEGSHNTTKAILGIIGPSVDNLDEAINWLYGDRRNNMEDLYDRVNMEHYGHELGGGAAGRHRDIRPDTIDMFPEVTGTTVTIRCATNAIENSNNKVQLYSWEDKLVFSISGRGHVSISDTTAAPSGADIDVHNTLGSATIIAQSDFASGSANFSAEMDGADYMARLTASKVLDACSLRMWTPTSDEVSWWLEDDKFELRGTWGVYLRIYGSGAYVEAPMDIIPETDTGSSLGSPSVWWDYLYAQFLNVDNVDTDLIPTVDDSLALGAYSYRWRQIYLSYNLYIEELTGSQSFPSIFIDKRYSHLPGLAGNIESVSTFLGSDSASNIRYGSYQKVEWDGNDGGNNLWHLAAHYSYYLSSNTASLNVTYGHGFRSRGYAYNGGGGKTVNFHHFYAEGLGGTAGAVDKQYGLYVTDLTLGALENWAIYTAGTTPSYFGGDVNIGGSVGIGGNLDVDGGDFTLTNGASTLAALGDNGTDGTFDIKDGASLIQLTGTDFYYAREWAQMEKTRHFAIWGLALENDWNNSEQTTDLVNVQPGAWFANGEIYAITSQVSANAGATGSQMNGASAPLFGWRFAFLHPTQGLWFGDYYPVNGRPNPDQSYAGLASQYRFPEQWIYVGAVFKDDTGGTPWVQRFIRRGDRVYMSYGDRHSYGHLDPESSTDIGTSGATSIVTGFSTLDCLIPAYDTKWPETLVSGLIFEVELVNGNSSATVDIYHGDGSGDRIRAAHIYHPATAGEDVRTYGPFVVSTKKNASSLSFDVEHRSAAGATTYFNMNVLGYVEPMLRAFDSRYIY